MQLILDYTNGNREYVVHDYQFDHHCILFMKKLWKEYINA